MTIARGQMKRQLYENGTMPEGGLPSLEDIMEGKVSPAEMALIRDTLEDEDFISMQEGYNLDDEKPNYLGRPFTFRDSKPMSDEEPMSDEMSDEEKRDMERLMEKQKLPAYQYDEKNPYTGPRDMRGFGGIMRGMKTLLDEAYDMVTSRSDFDFSDYKMRGQLMAEELAEIKFKKDFDDLDQKTQMDLIEQASDYLNDVADDAADNAYDMMKERFDKAEGGIMSVDREKFGIGSKLKKTIRKLIPNELSKIGQKVAPVVGFFNPALGATIQGISSFDQSGRIGDSLKRAGLQYLATQGARGLTGGTDAIQDIPGSGSEFLSFTNPANVEPFLGQTGEFFNLGSPSTFSLPTSMSDIVSQDSLLSQGADFVKKAANTLINKGAKDEELSSFERVIKGVGALKDIAKVALMGKVYFDSREDQERFNKLAEEAYRKYNEAREKKRQQYGVGEGEGITVLNPTRTKADVVEAARGGIINSRKGYMMGSEIPIRENQAGVSEMDFRETGGFVPPVGIKEKADDIPAMLSNNEFVFTADAVRAAGGGSVNKGAQKMYALMKQLEGQA